MKGLHEKSVSSKHGITYYWTNIIQSDIALVLLPGLTADHHLFWLTQLEWMCKLFPNKILRSSMAKMCGATEVAQKRMLTMIDSYSKKEATYQEIKNYILEKHGVKVSSLYISQIKRKCGLDVGDSYNKPKSEDAHVPQCPPEKENAIMDALKHYGII